MSTLLKKQSEEYTYQDQPSGIVIAKHQIIVPKSIILISEAHPATDGNNSTEVANNNQIMVSHNTLIIGSNAEFGKTILVKGR